MRVSTYRRLCFLEIALLSLGLTVEGFLALFSFERWAMWPIVIVQLIAAVSCLIRFIGWREASLRGAFLLLGWVSLSGLLDSLDLHQAASAVMIVTQYGAALFSAFRISIKFSVSSK